ncbi:MAG TPA: hypothetical protein VN864_06400 [Thermoplasmata archaeon]|nr:hypothetical protein [Thermoplasmata archaeon]
MRPRPNSGEGGTRTITQLLDQAALALAVSLGLLGAVLLLWRWSSQGGSAVWLATSLMVRDLRIAAALLLATVLVGFATAYVMAVSLEAFARLDPVTDAAGFALLLLGSVAFLGVASTVSVRVDRAVAYAHGRRNLRRSSP